MYVDVVFIYSFPGLREAAVGWSGFHAIGLLAFVVCVRLGGQSGGMNPEWVLADRNEADRLSAGRLRCSAWGLP